jgi:hypothetical protein
VMMGDCTTTLGELTPCACIGGIWTCPTRDVDGG